jgi:hypothetical protein
MTTQENAIQAPEQVVALVPTQPEAEQLSAIEKARQSDKRTKITLSTREVIEQMSQFGTEARQYKDTSPIQGEYYQFKFGGAILTAEPKFKEAFVKGEVVSATLTPTVFEQIKPDPNNAGATKPVVGFGWSLDSFTTVEQLSSVQDTMAKVAAIDLKIKLQAAKSNAAIASITPENINKFISDEEISKMLAAV